MFYVNARFEPDAEKGGFVVEFPDLPCGVTQGESEQEALEMAADVATMILNELIKRGQELPTPTKRRGHRYRIINLPALVTAKVELYQSFRASGIRKAELARRLGMSKGNIDRLFSLRHQSRLDQIEAAFAAVGKRLTVLIEAA